MKNKIEDIISKIQTKKNRNGNSNYDNMTNPESEKIFNNELKTILEIPNKTSPKVVFLIAPPGAGKSSAEEEMGVQEFYQWDIDLLRDQTEYFTALQGKYLDDKVAFSSQENDKAMGVETSKIVNPVGDTILDVLTSGEVQIDIAFHLGGPDFDWISGQMQLFKDKGYEVELATIAIPKEVVSLRGSRRYENQKVHGVGRHTDKKYLDGAYEKSNNFIKKITAEHKDLIDKFSIFDMNSNKIYSEKGIDIKDEEVLYIFKKEAEERIFSKEEITDIENQATVLLDKFHKRGSNSEEMKKEIFETINSVFKNVGLNPNDSLLKNTPNWLNIIPKEQQIEPSKITDDYPLKNPDDTHKYEHTGITFMLENTNRLKMSDMAKDYKKGVTSQKKHKYNHTQ